MPKVALSTGEEIDELEFINSRKLRDTVAKIMKHPKAALLVEQAQKLVDPTAVTPNLDAQVPLDERFGEVTKKLDEVTKQLADEKESNIRKEQLAALNARVEAGIKKLREQGWTDEGITGVRKLMEDKGLLDAEDAAAIFEKQHPPATPIIPTAGSGSWDFIGGTEAGSDETLKRLVAARGESEGVTDQMVRDILQDVRGQRR